MKTLCKTLCTMFMPLLVVAQTNPAQDRPAVSTGEVRFYVDRASFRGAQNKIYVEFYQMLYADQLRHISKNGKHYAVFRNSTILKDHQQNEMRRREWATEASVVLDSTRSNALAIYDQWAEELAPGSYMLEVAVADLNGPNKGRANFAFEVSPMMNGKFSASQLEFAVHVEDRETDKRFTKGRRTIVPNPSRRYGVLNPTLYFHYELYNIPGFGGEELTANYAIRDQSGADIKTFPQIAMRKPGATASVVHGVDVSTVPSGIYELSAQIVDSSNGEQVVFTRQFEVVQMDYLSAPQLTAEQSELAGRLLKYCATPEEYRFYQQLNAAGQAQFLIRFWRDRDPTPETDANEYLEQMQRRYLYASAHFGWSTEEGWASERGRVLIQYGSPDEIEHHHSEAETVPYEIWIYAQERRFDFVFADLQSNGRFVLVHSSKEGEVHNSDWRRLIQRL